MTKTHSPFPSFIGIGATKSGTTWLYKNLKSHPDIWLPPKKELHYFDRSPKYPSPSTLACSRSLIKRFLSFDDANKKYRIQLAKSIYSVAKDFSFERLQWYTNFFFGRHDHDWYLSLFEGSKCPVRGEITPAYSMLDESDVEQVFKVAPEAKIIFLLRNPIDRTWSAIRYRQQRKRKYRNLTSLPISELSDVIDHPSFELRSDYLRTLRAWRQYFPEEQVFVGFYDEIQENPVGLLLRLFEFLGVESSNDVVPDSVAKRVNASPAKGIPEELHYHLAARYRPMVQQLSEQFGSYAQAWLKDIDQAMKTTASLGS